MKPSYCRSAVRNKFKNNNQSLHYIILLTTSPNKLSKISTISTYHSIYIDCVLHKRLTNFNALVMILQQTNFIVVCLLLLLNYEPIMYFSSAAAAAFEAKPPSLDFFDGVAAGFSTPLAAPASVILSFDVKMEPFTRELARHAAKKKIHQ